MTNTSVYLLNDTENPQFYEEILSYLDVKIKSYESYLNKKVEYPNVDINWGWFKFWDKDGNTQLLAYNEKTIVSYSLWIWEDAIDKDLNKRSDNVDFQLANRMIRILRQSPSGLELLRELFLKNANIREEVNPFAWAKSLIWTARILYSIKESTDLVQLLFKMPATAFKNLAEDALEDLILEQLWDVYKKIDEETNLLYGADRQYKTVTLYYNTLIEIRKFITNIASNRFSEE